MTKRSNTPSRRRTAARPSSGRQASGTPASRRGAAAARRTPAPFAVAAVVGIVMLLVFAASTLQRCDGETASVSGGATPYVSPYDWETGLSRTGDRLTYTEGGTVKSQVGVDVSEHQGAIDWQAVAGDGIDFAFVRAGSRGYTEGGLYADARFAENVDGAEAAGLEVGVYFFSQATSVEEALEEAEFVLELLDGRDLALPVAFDHERVAEAGGRANGVDGKTLTAAASAFCARIEEAGYDAMVYGNASDIARYDAADLGGYPIWFAEYDAAVPHAQFDFAVWQYTNAGTVAGISTAVDLNLRMTDAL